MKGFAKDGQTHCCDCGRAFMPDQDEWDSAGVVATSCPTEGCNRGSWWHREPDRDYCVPVGDLREAAAALGRKGGSARSEAKTAAVRENGRKRTTKLRALITQHGWLPGQDVEQWIGFSDLIAESTARKYEKKGWLKNIGHRVLTQEGYRNA